MSEHIPHSGHDHGHSHAPPSNNVAFAAGVALNLGFVVAEIVYGLAANSLALLSDAGHNATDVLGLLIAWAAIHLSKSMPTKRRTYGLRGFSILAALANAVILLIVVGGITWEAIQRIASPEPVVGGTVIFVAAGGVVINTVSALLFMAGRDRDLNIKAAFLHMAADAAVSLGVVFVGLAIRATGWYWLDPAVSIVVGFVIVWGTWGLLREAVNLALDAVPAGIKPDAVERYLSGLAGVESVHDLHIWGMSTTETALTAHLVMPLPPADDTFLHEVTHKLRERFQICHITVQIEHGDGDIPCHQAPTDVV
jgi:cobalt-zinc-cadmium efflux system protein